MKPKDYFPLYIGRPIELHETRFSEEQKDRTFTLSGVTEDKFQVKETEIWYDLAEYRMQSGPIDQLLLRPLSTMSEDEMKECFRIGGEKDKYGGVVNEIKFGSTTNIINIKYSGKPLNGGSGYTSGSCTMYLNQIDSDQLMYLIKQGFDIFELIEKGYAKPALR